MTLTPSLTSLASLAPEPVQPQDAPGLVPYFDASCLPVPSSPRGGTPPDALEQMFAYFEA